MERDEQRGVSEYHWANVGGIPPVSDRSRNQVDRGNNDAHELHNASSMFWTCRILCDGDREDCEDCDGEKWIQLREWRISIRSLPWFSVC